MDMVAVKAKRSSSLSFSTNSFHAFTKDETVTSRSTSGQSTCPRRVALLFGDFTLMLPVAATTAAWSTVALMAPFGTRTDCLAFLSPAARGASVEPLVEATAGPNPPVSRSLYHPAWAAQEPVSHPFGPPRNGHRIRMAGIGRLCLRLPQLEGHQPMVRAFF